MCGCVCVDCVLKLENASLRAEHDVLKLLLPEDSENEQVSEAACIPCKMILENN